MRSYLRTKPDGSPLPGAARIIAVFDEFKGELPSLAAALQIGADEIDPFRNYRDYVALLAEFLKSFPA